MTIMERINKAPLTRDLMKKMLTAVDEMPAEQRSDFTGRGIGLLNFLRDEFPDQGNHDRASILMAFQFRMEALIALRNRPEYEAWTLQIAKHTKEPDIINEALIDAAAEEPLIDHEKQPFFDPPKFFARALALSESEGHA